MKDLAIFHTLAHVSIAFIGAVLLLAIWYNIRKRFKARLEENEGQQRVDKGLMYLSLALFVWVGSGVWGYAATLWSFEQRTTYLLGISLLSTLNNLFILLALFIFLTRLNLFITTRKTSAKSLL